MTSTPPAPASTADIDLVDDGTHREHASLHADSPQLGTKTFTENVPAGWTLDSAGCDDAGSPIADGVSVDVAAGDDDHLHVRRHAGRQLTIVKQATPEGATSFDFDATGPASPPTSTSSTTAPAPATTTSLHLDSTQLGTKTVAENVPPAGI